MLFIIMMIRVHVMHYLLSLLIKEMNFIITFILFVLVSILFLLIWIQIQSINHIDNHVWASALLSCTASRFSLVHHASEPTMYLYVFWAHAPLFMAGLFSSFFYFLNFLSSYFLLLFFFCPPPFFLGLSFFCLTSYCLAYNETDKY